MGVYSTAYANTAHFESKDEMIVERKIPLPYDKPLVSPTIKQIIPVPLPKTSAFSPTALSNAVSPNLISNPSVENPSSSASIPANWAKGGYGSNTRVLKYPVVGFNSTKAIQVEISNYTTGDAKWFFNEVPITPGKIYTFSDLYTSNIPSIVDVRFKMADGTYKYKDVAFLGPTDSATSFKNVSVQIIAPDQAVSLTVFHLINKNGYLITDEFSLSEISTDPLPPPDPTNLVANSDFEQTDVGGMPSNWKKGGWGTKSAQFTYPETSIDGSKAARIDITSYTSGDAKWYFTPIMSPTSGIYTYSDVFKSNIKSTLTAQFQDASGTYSYKDIAVLPASDSFQSVSVDFAVPNGTKNVTVFHLIGAVGFLTIDNVAMRFKSLPTGIFTTGAVTFRFDDGWTSQYNNVLPRLNALGIKGTFFITTKQTGDDGYPAYMTKNQISQIYSQGHEIGAHTRTHQHLSALTLDQQTAEISGSRQDLLNMNVGPINTFAYPFGDYNANTLSIVKNSGFIAAVSTISGFVNPASDPYQLESRTITVNTTVTQIKGWIDDASTNKKWLILAFHEVNTSGNLYSITPDNFDQILNYVSSKKIPTVTVQQGVQSVQ